VDTYIETTTAFQINRLEASTCSISGLDTVTYKETLKQLFARLFGFESAATFFMNKPCIDLRCFHQGRLYRHEAMVYLNCFCIFVRHKQDDVSSWRLLRGTVREGATLSVSLCVQQIFCIHGTGREKNVLGCKFKFLCSRCLALCIVSCTEDKGALVFCIAKRWFSPWHSSFFNPSARRHPCRLDRRRLPFLRSLRSRLQNPRPPSCSPPGTFLHNSLLLFRRPCLRCRCR
jgi:hypothetical protein